MKQQSLQLADRHWEALERMAKESGSLGREGPSWRVLIRRIAEGELVIGGEVSVKPTVQVAMSEEQWEALQALLDGSGNVDLSEPVRVVQGAPEAVSEPVRVLPVEVSVPGVVRAVDLGFVAAPSSLAPRTTAGDLRGEELERAKTQQARKPSKFSQERQEVPKSTEDLGGGYKLERFE